MEPIQEAFGVLISLFHLSTYQPPALLHLPQDKAVLSCQQFSPRPHSLSPLPIPAPYPCSLSAAALH